MKRVAKRKAAPMPKWRRDLLGRVDYLAARADALEQAVRGARQQADAAQAEASQLRGEVHRLEGHLQALERIFGSSGVEPRGYGFAAVQARLAEVEEPPEGAEEADGLIQRFNAVHGGGPVEFYPAMALPEKPDGA